MINPKMLPVFLKYDCWFFTRLPACYVVVGNVGAKLVIVRGKELKSLVSALSYLPRLIFRVLWLVKCIIFAFWYVHVGKLNWLIISPADM